MDEQTFYKSNNIHQKIMMIKKILIKTDDGYKFQPDFEKDRYAINDVLTIALKDEFLELCKNKLNELEEEFKNL